MTIALWAIHLADGTLGPLTAATGFILASGLLRLSLVGLRDDEVSRLGVLTSAFFVASLIHLPVGVSSAHLLLNGLTGVLLGRGAVIAISLGLFLQAVLFSHGGLSTLGVNIVIYALPALVAGLTYRPIRRRKLLPDFWLGLLFGLATSAATLGLNFFVLTFLSLEDWRTLAWLVFVLNLPVVAVESVGLGFTTQYLAKVKPEWLESGNKASP